jgi:hypothetical protein
MCAALDSTAPAIAEDKSIKTLLMLYLHIGTGWAP